MPFTRNEMKFQCSSVFFFFSDSQPHCINLFFVLVYQRKRVNDLGEHLQRVANDQILFGLEQLASQRNLFVIIGRSDQELREGKRNGSRKVEIESRRQFQIAIVVLFVRSPFVHLQQNQRQKSAVVCSFRLRCA